MHESRGEKRAKHSKGKQCLALPPHSGSNLEKQKQKQKIEAE